MCWPRLCKPRVSVRLKPYQFCHKTSYHIAQLSDCHLLATIDGIYQQIKPAEHLAAIVTTLISEQPDAVLLTGDMTQDHSAASYRLLAQLMAPLNCPVFCLPGNHDDLESLDALCQLSPFRPERSLQLKHWQLLLLNTKGPTPAGIFPVAQQNWLAAQCQQSNAQTIWLFCHHHPRLLNSFIDKHGQLNEAELWQAIAAEPRIKGIAHGHAHYAYQAHQQNIDIVGCPASSVQFLPTADWHTVNGGPQWCDWFFSATGDVRWQFRQLDLTEKK